MKHVILIAAMIALTACQTTVRGQKFTDDTQLNIDATIDKGLIRTSTALGDATGLYAVTPDEDALAKGAGVADAKFANISKNLKGKKAPVFIYQHGCAGVLLKDINLVNNIARKSKKEFVAIYTDTFARLRPDACDQFNLSITSFYNRSLDYRRAELQNVINKLAKQDWVKEVWLMGHSQGGSVVSEFINQSSTVKVAGRILYAGASTESNIEDGEKVYVIHSKNDPWKWIANNSRCPEFGRDHNGTLDISDLPTHSLLSRDKHFDKLVKWLDDSM